MPKSSTTVVVKVTRKRHPVPHFYRQTTNKGETPSVYGNGYDGSLRKPANQPQPKSQ